MTPAQTRDALVREIDRAIGDLRDAARRDGILRQEKLYPEAKAKVLELIAAKAYNKSATELFGEHAKQNNLD